MPVSPHPKRVLARKLLTEEERKMNTPVFQSAAWLSRKYNAWRFREKEAEQEYQKARLRELNKKVGFFGRLKYLWLRTRIAIRGFFRRTTQGLINPLSVTST